MKQNKPFFNKSCKLKIAPASPIFPPLVDKDVNLGMLAGAEGWKIIAEWELPSFTDV